MKKINFKSLLMGLILGVTLSLAVTSASALRAAKTIQADYHDIKISIDGVVITPRDADGDIVEPFTYEDNTYLPVRAIANALGKNVDWDGPSETVIITTPNGGTPSPGAGKAVNFDTLTPQKTFSNSELTTWKSTDRDLLANSYNNGIILRNTTGSPQTAEYLLSNGYANFSGKVVPVTGVLSSGAKYTLNIYGDGELLYTTPSFTSDNMIFSDDFDLDVSSVQVLKLELVTAGTTNTGLGLVHGALISK